MWYKSLDQQGEILLKDPYASEKNKLIKEV